MFLLCQIGSQLSAQTVGTLGLGTSIVEYDGFLLSGAAVAAPAIHYDGDRATAGAQASWVIFESGNEILQFTAAGAWLTKPLGRWRAEFSGSVGAGKYEGETGYGHLLARSRVHYSGIRAGAWFGIGTGQSFGDFDATPVELSLGSWTVQDRVALAGSITATELSGAGYVDIIGAARWTSGIVQLDFQAGLRPVSDVGGKGAYGDVAALVSFNNKIAMTLSAGRYQSDPARGVLGAKYLNIGVRMNLFGTRTRDIPTINRAMLRAASALAATAHASPANLQVTGSSRSVVLRVTARAGSVELMGDFTDWQPVSLHKIDDNTWELTMPIPSGVHRLNIRIDGAEWLVPTGTRRVETDFGAPVGIVVIP